MTDPDSNRDTTIFRHHERCMCRMPVSSGNAIPSGAREAPKYVQIRADPAGF
jgi:hypothetical protein